MHMLTRAALAALVVSLSSPAAIAQVAPQPREAGALSQLQPGQMRITDYFDREIMTSDGTAVGELGDLIMEGDRIVAAIIDLEQRLGLGERRVAVPIARLQPEGDQLRLDMTREQLAQLPAFRDRE